MTRIIPRIILVLLCLLLAGCLTTPRPVFDATNSLAAGESPAFMAFVESWERWVGEGDSPRELIEEGARVVEIDGQAVIEERRDDGRADHYLLGRMGGRPVSCVLNDRGIEVVAAKHGVTVTVERDPDSDPAMPAPIGADGTDAALNAFIRDAFANAALSCSAAARGG